MNDDKMQVVKSVRITLTMDDIVQNLSLLSKQQILEKFRLLLDRKEIEINEKIQKNNAQHLLVLQKKMVVLERKDDQIFKLNNALSTYKNELNDQKIKNNQLTDQALENKMKALHFQKKYNDFDSILKDQKAKRQKLKKEHEKLQADYKLLYDEHHKEIRTHKKVKEQKVNWQQQTEMLLNNLKKKHEQQLQDKIKMINLEWENKLTDLSQNLHTSQIKSDNYKQKYQEAKVNISNLNKAIEILNKELMNEKTKQKKIHKQVVETQTDDALIESAYTLGNLFRKEFYDQITKKMLKEEVRTEPHVQIPKEQKEVQIMIEIQCSACKDLKIQNETLENQLRTLRPKETKNAPKSKLKSVNSQASQTNPPPLKTYLDAGSQTLFRALSQQEEQSLYNSFNVIKTTSEGIINSLNKKYDKLEALFLSRPSKQSDREKIRQLERKLILQQMTLLKKVKEIQGSQLLVSQLQHKINQQASLLNQFNIDDVQVRPIQVKIDVGPSSIDAETNLNANYGNRKRFSSNDRKGSTSISISVKQSIRNNRSLSPRFAKSRNYSQTEGFLNQKFRETTGQNPQTPTDQERNRQQFQSMLVSRGINFKLKAKDSLIEQISEFRQYKKFKGSLKKVRL